MCIFCKLKEEGKIIYENAYVYALYDQFPVSKGHALIITKRHTENFFTATNEEKKAMDQAILSLKKKHDAMYQPDGYNIGINNGKAAGQTIFHLHVHLIPRYLGDDEKPEGGVRGVIPEKKGY